MEIIDYPDYLIYLDGKVYNQKNKRYIIQSDDGKGYLKLKLNGDFKRIHRLLAIHYIPNPDNKSTIDHIDGNKLNNDISNLRWVNQIENSNAYRSIPKNNTSGIKNICYHKRTGVWYYRKNYYGKSFERSSKNKQLVLWVKFVDNLLFN
tara:strand:+ start:51 stop:497 length:447 start_codon:yes stop_codon:yes gene_type:complete